VKHVDEDVIFPLKWSQFWSHLILVSIIVESPEGILLIKDIFTVAVQLYTNLLLNCPVVMSLFPSYSVDTFHGK